ncbi:MAG: MFS transporter [Enhydrobacter sp.]|nr:MFS transporter [Enhydrobacter sp.]
MGGAGGGDADEPAAGLGLCLQRPPASARAGPCGQPLGALAGVRRGDGRLHHRLGRGALRLSCRTAAAPRYRRRPAGRGRRHGCGDGDRALATAAGLRRGVRHRRRHGLHPVTAGREHAGARRRGLINGYLVSLYPMGAMIATPAFNACNEAYGWRTTLGGLGVVLVATGIIAALLAWLSGARLAAPRVGTTNSTTGSKGERPAVLGLTFFKLAGTFFFAASAGLMVLSQAREIIATYGGATTLAVAATTGLSAAIAAARISGGWLVDRFAVPHVMCAAHALALCGGLLVTFFPAPVTAVLGLGMVGVGYGFISGSTAAGVALYWPPADYGRVAGRTYIAWCAAAIGLPVLAGYLFDMTHSYVAAMMIAVAANVTGMAAALTLPKRGWRDSV